MQTGDRERPWHAVTWLVWALAGTASVQLAPSPVYVALVIAIAWLVVSAYGLDGPFAPRVPDPVGARRRVRVPPRRAHRAHDARRPRRAVHRARASRSPTCSAGSRSAARSSCPIVLQAANEGFVIVGVIAVFGAFNAVASHYELVQSAPRAFHELGLIVVGGARVRAVDDRRRRRRPRGRPRADRRSRRAARPAAAPDRAGARERARAGGHARRVDGLARLRARWGVAPRPGRGLVRRRLAARAGVGVRRAGRAARRRSPPRSGSPAVVGLVVAIRLASAGDARVPLPAAAASPAPTASCARVRSRRRSRSAILSLAGDDSLSWTPSPLHWPTLHVLPVARARRPAAPARSAARTARRHRSVSRLVGERARAWARSAEVGRDERDRVPRRVVRVPRRARRRCATSTSRSRPARSCSSSARRARARARCCAPRTGSCRTRRGGRFAGDVVAFGRSTRTPPAPRARRRRRLRHQDPEAQFVVDHVEHDVAFVLENLALPDDGDAPPGRGGARRARHRAPARPLARRRSPAASANAPRSPARSPPRPSALVLDEPTSQLDPQGADDVLAAVAPAQRRPRHHRAARRAPARAGRAARRPGRRARARAAGVAGTGRGAVARRLPGRAERHPARAPARLGPAAAHRARRTRVRARRPVGPRPGRRRRRPRPRHRGRGSRLDVLVAAHGVVGRARRAPGAARRVARRPRGRGRRAARPQRRGQDHAAARARPAPRARRRPGRRPRLRRLRPPGPEHAAVPADGAAEVAETLRLLGRRDRRPRRRPLARRARPRPPSRDRHPRSLSGGERQRVAIAAVAVGGATVLLLDEPTRGMDAAVARTRSSGPSREHAPAGGAVVLATHDVELAARCATTGRRARRRRRRRRRTGARRARGLAVRAAGRSGCCPPFLTVEEVEAAWLGHGTAVVERGHDRVRGWTPRPRSSTCWCSSSARPRSSTRSGSPTHALPEPGPRRRRAAVGRGRRRARRRRGDARGAARHDERRHRRDPRRARRRPPACSGSSTCPEHGAASSSSSCSPAPRSARASGCCSASARWRCRPSSPAGSGRGCRSRCSRSGGWAAAPASSAAPPRGSRRVPRSSCSPRTAGCWGFLYGAIMNLWFWPFVRATARRRGAPASAFAETLHHYWSFYVATSFAWDAAGALCNAVLILADRRRAHAHPPPLRPPPRTRRRARLTVAFWPPQNPAHLRSFRAEGRTGGSGSKSVTERPASSAGRRCGGGSRRSCPSGSRTAGGSTSRQTSIAYGQRGWKRQPDGGASGLGMSPCEHDARAARAARPGRAPGSPTAAPRCRGASGRRYTSSAAPISTMRPRYMTAMRSLMWRTTARSCEMNRYVSPSCSCRSASRLITSASAAALDGLDARAGVHLHALGSRTSP